MNILVTGANGLVGSSVVKRFVKENHTVHALCRSGADLSLLEGVEEKILLIEGDILDVLGLDVAFQDIDVVIHTAAVVSFVPKDRVKMYQTNVEGTTNVVNACLTASVKQLVFVSSVAALGRPSNLKNQKGVIAINENQKWEDSPQNSHYAKSKYLAECEVWRGQAEGLNVTVVNPSVILGEGDWHRSSTRLFKYIYDGNKFYTGGTLNYIDLKDLTEVIYQLTEQHIFGERFILSAGIISYQDFFDKIATAFDKKPPSMLVQPWLAEIIWRIEAFRSFITGSSPLITRETAQAAKSHFQYKNDKIQAIPGVNFTPIDKTINRVVAYLKGQNP